MFILIPAIFGYVQEEDFIYGGNMGLTGFALLADDVDVNYIGLIFLVFIIIAGFLVHRIWRLWRRARGRKARG